MGNAHDRLICGTMSAVAMNWKIQNRAFVAPKMSRDLSEYFEGILDFVKYDPSIFLHSFTFTDRNIAERVFKAKTGLTMSEYRNQR